MITITVHRGAHIESLEVKGHAESNVYGKDLVCAIISGITTGLANALDEMIHEENISLTEGYAEIVITDPNEKSDTIMNTAIIMYRTAEEANKDFIKIMEV